MPPAHAAGTCSRPELLMYSRSGFDRHLRAEPGVRLIGLRDLFRPELEFERPPRPAAPEALRALELLRREDEGPRPT